jgi:hypothetical protein
MGHEDVQAALKIFAPARARKINDGIGYQYLVEIAARAAQAEAAIRPGKGRDTLGPSLGRVAPRLLCAVLAVEALQILNGRPPSEKNETALRLCNALWLAAGGKEVGGDATDTGRGEAGGAGAWPRNIRDAKRPRLPANAEDWTRADTMAASALISARRTARDCLKSVRRK